MIWYAIALLVREEEQQIRVGLHGINVSSGQNN